MLSLPPELPLLKPSWLIVIATDNARGASGTLWARLEAMTRARRDVRVAVVDSHEPDGDLTAYAAVIGRTGFRYVSLPSSPALVENGFNLPRAYNVGASVFSEAPLLLFLHDDCDLPDDSAGGWLDKLRAALMTPGVGLAVPTITGDCGNPVQGMALLGELPWVETVEFISPACVAMTRHGLRNVQGWDESFTGYEWSQVHLQWKVASLGLSTVVVPAADKRLMLHHFGGGTYDRTAQDAAMAANGKRYAEKSGARWEYKMRPDRPRIAPDRWGDHERDSAGLLTEDSLCFVVDSEKGVVEALALRRTNPAYLDVVIVDTAPCKAHFDLVQGGGEEDVFADASRLPRYFAAWDTDPVRQAVGSAASESVKVYDLRAGHALPVKAVEGKRLRIGAHYDLAERLERIEIGMVRDVGIGDSLMLGPAIRAFKKAYPNCRTVVTHCWEAGEILRHLPFLDEVNIAKPDDFHPLELFNGGEGSGSEGTISAMYQNLGMEDDGSHRLEYHVQPAERERAIELLREWAGEDAPKFGDYLLAEGVKPWLLGIQVNGGWESKLWKNAPTLIDQAVEDGWWVLVFGNEGDRALPISQHRRVLTVKGTTIREAVALIACLDVFVGMDSGLTFAASAVQTAFCALYGPHDPKGLIMDTAPVNGIAVRVRTPQMCYQEFGASCRVGDQQTGGSKCPLEGDNKYLCLSEISPCSVMDHVLELPMWDKSLGERW